MVAYLCGLTPAQWTIAHQTDPAGSTRRRPEGYTRAGLYEGKDTLWLIQYAGHFGYRYWHYRAVFEPSLAGDELDELLEVALQARSEADKLRQQALALIEEADRLCQVAADTYNQALVGGP